MSRSKRAWMESCAPVSAAIGAGERAGLEEQAPLGPGLLLGAVSSTKRLITFLVASMLVIALAPASALAGAASGHAKPSVTQKKQQSAHIHQAGAVVLAPGSGYLSRDDAARVRALQRRLARAGCAPGPIDGRYGSLTEQAVIRFQAARGLEVDGIAGPLTLAAISRASVVLYPGAGYAGHGSRRVRVLQRRLARAGYAPGLIDGRYGPVTERAVLAFQTAYGLALDGIAGPRTLARLAIAEPLLYPGSRDSRAVRALQRALASAGDRPGPIDGRYGPITEHAVRRFQTQHHLSVDGIAGPRTLSQLHPHTTSQPAPRASAHPRAAKPNPRPQHARQPVSAQRQAPRPPASVGHRRPGPSSSFAWVLLLGVVVLALVLMMWWFTRGRRSSRRISRSIALSASEPGPEPAPLERGGAEAAFRAQDQGGDGRDESDLGVLLEDQGDLEGAEAAFRRSDQRGDAKGAFNLGVLLSRRGDLTEAKAAYARSDQRGDAKGAFNLGVLLDNQGDLQGARAAFARADQRGDIKGALNLAVLLDDQGDPDGAEAAYARARKRGDSDDAELARAAPLEPYDRLQTHVEARLQSRTQQWLQAHGEVRRR